MTINTDPAIDLRVDEAKLQEFMGRMVGYMTGGAVCFGVWLGDELVALALERHGWRSALAVER